MSALAKTLVILNLVLGVLFLSVSATLWATSSEYRSETLRLRQEFSDARSDYEDELEAENQRVTKMHETVQARRSAVARLTSELSGAASQLAEQNRRWEAAATSREDQFGERESQDRDLASRADEISRLEADLAAANNARAEAEQQTRDDLAARDRMRRDLVHVSREREELEGERQALEDSLGALTARVEAMQARVGEDFDPTKTVPDAVDASVVAVDRGLGAVVLDAGRSQNVRVGTQFSVLRGDRVIGLLKVAKLYADRSGALVLQERSGAQIRAGDRATTRMDLGK